MTSLTRTKSTKNKRTANKVNAQELFNSALERYQRLKKKNNNFGHEIQALIERVSPQIEPYEIQKYRQLHALTLKLITFFGKKTLPEYLRKGLFDWICENLHNLNNNPYSHHLNIDELESTMDKQRKQYFSNHQEKIIKDLEKQGASDEEIEEVQNLSEKIKNVTTPEELEDLLKETLNSDAAEFDDDFNEDLFESLFEEQEAMDFDFEDHIHDEFTHHNQNPFEQLFKQSSINILFRRIARAIHPDLEQDEKQKAVKHQQMSRLIEARETKDIAYILQTYKETFGQLPETFPDEDYRNLTKIVKHMTNQLADQKFEVLDSIPYGHAYYELFYHKTRKKEAAAIAEHIKIQKEAVKHYKSILNEATNLKKLKPLLQTRIQLENIHYDDMMFDEAE